jgi:hypothetical protein
VFDDTDPEQTSYLGFAEVPMIPLCHNKGIQGVFELRGPMGSVNGTIEVEIRWQEAYITPKGVVYEKEVNTRNHHTKFYLGIHLNICIKDYYKL